MDQQRTPPRRGPSDASDYSSTQAPETQSEAEEQVPPSDPRLHPGGAMGSATDPGMSSLDRDIPPSGGYSPRQQDIGSTRE